MAIYCTECGKDITAFIEDCFESCLDEKDIICRQCYKNNEQLNKGKYDD